MSEQVTETKPAVVPENTDVISQIEKARTEEKNKLYPQIENLKKSKEEMERKLEEQAAVLKRLQSAVKEGEEVDINVIATRVAQNTATEMQAIYDAKLKVVQDELNKQKQLAEQRELALFKEEEIRKAGGSAEMITEMVSGGTREEILAKIEQARKIKAKIREETLELVKQSGGGTGQLTLNQNTNAAVTPLPPGGKTGGATSEEILLDSVTGMSPAEYSRNREKILELASKRMQGRQAGVGI